MKGHITMGTSEEIGKRIKKLLDEKGLTQEKFANQLSNKGINVSQNQISRLCSGKQKNLDPDLMIKISEILGKSLDWIITGRETDTHKPQKYTMRDFCRMFVQLRDYTPFEISISDDGKVGIIFNTHIAKNSPLLNEVTLCEKLDNNDKEYRDMVAYTIWQFLKEYERFRNLKSTLGTNNFDLLLGNALDKVDNCTPSEMKAINNACKYASGLHHGNVHLLPIQIENFRLMKEMYTNHFETKNDIAKNDK